MRLMKQIGSEQVILSLSAIMGGIIVAVSIGNNDPVRGTIGLLRSHPFAVIPVLFLGFSFMVRGIDRTLNGWRRYYASILINLSMALFIFTLLYTILFVSTESIKVVEGETIMSGIIVENINLDLPDEVLVIGDDAGVQIRNPVAVVQSGNERANVRSFPFSRFAGLYGYVNDAGISPQCEIRLLETVTRTDFSQILPPGKKEKLTIDSESEVLIELAPDRTLRKGRLEARVFDLTAPSFHIKIETNGKEVLYDGIVQANTTEQNGNVHVRCGKNFYWVEIVTQKSGSFLYLYFSEFGIFAGLLLLPVQFLRKKS